jgi:hypothetical protein
MLFVNCGFFERMLVLWVFDRMLVSWVFERMLWVFVVSKGGEVPEGVGRRWPSPASGVGAASELEVFMALWYFECLCVGGPGSEHTHGMLSLDFLRSWLLPSRLLVPLMQFVWPIEGKKFHVECLLAGEVPACQNRVHEEI